MYKGRPCVFLSCSERFKERVARPLKAGLADAGVYGVIVADEPHPAGVRPEPGAKVDYFLDQSDAMVALCTPDDQLPDHTVQPRGNIIDEMQRAWSRPHLATRVQTLKERTVRLPSNINPTYDRLELDDPAANLRRVLLQLAEWGVLPAARPTPAAEDDARPGDRIGNLLDGLSLGDWDEAERRTLEAFGSLSKSDQAATIRQLADYLFATSDQTQMHIAAMLIEQAGRLDLSLIPTTLIERLATDAATPRRMCATGLLWDRAAASPGEVPLDILQRLAAPTREDWYVFAPALGCLRELLLHRPTASILVHQIASSADVDDRREAARVLRDVAEVQPNVIDDSMIAWFRGDQDNEVREAISKAEEFAALHGGARPRRGQAGWFTV